jgi:hypothetical protein
MDLIIPLCDELRPVTPGASKRVIRIPRPRMLFEVRADVTSVQTSGAPIHIDIKRGGLSLLTAPLEIANGSETTNGTAVLPCGGVYLADNDKLSFDVIQAGTGGKGLKVSLLTYPAVGAPIPEEPEDPEDPPPGLVDVSTSGQAFGSSMIAGLIGQVFDKDQNTRVYTNEHGPPVQGTSWAGQDFGVTPRAIKRVILAQGVPSPFYVQETVASVKIQTADAPAGPWTDVQTFSVAQASGDQILDISGTPPAKRCWRVLANAPTVLGYRWVIDEISMWA